MPAKKTLRIIKFFSAILLIFMLSTKAYAKLHTETVEYKHGDIILQGYLVYDDSIKGKVPGVLIVHEWTGLGTYVKRRAEQIAGLGYVAFAADIYGKGVRPKDAQEAAAQAGFYRANLQLMRSRVKVGLDELKKCKFVDPKRVAAVGYCFGGGVALELARSGEDIAGVVSFHGNLNTSQPEDAKNIKAKILVCHGANDPFVNDEQVAVFENEMRAANVDWQMIIYGNAVHSFTNPDSGNNPAVGFAYNELADKRSWKAMKSFFNEIFSDKELKK